MWGKCGKCCSTLWRVGLITYAAVMSLQTKLFFAVAFAVCSIAVASLLAQQHFTHRDFVDYQLANRQQAAETLSMQLAANYEGYGSWRELLNEAPRWPALHRPLLKYLQSQRRAIANDAVPFDQRRPPPGAHPPHRPPPPEFEQNGKPNDLGPNTSQEIHVFTLHDASRTALTGGFAADQAIAWKVIALKGEAIGWLSYPLKPTSVHPLDAEFELRQQKLLLALLALSIVLALLVAWALSGLFLGRIKQLLNATSRVAQGDLSVRVEPGTADELGRLVIAFNDMTIALERSAERESNWLADVAHELRTPLATLTGEIEALIDGVRPLSQVAMSSLWEEVVHLGKLLDDLHFLSSHEQGSLKLEYTLVDLSEFFRSILKQHQSVLSAAGLNPIGEFNDKVIVDVDEKRLRQVLNNLLQNALHYASSGALRCAVYAESGQAILQMEDDGPGVPDSALVKIFDRLYRVDTSRESAPKPVDDHSHRGTGSGLGLAICKSLIEAHGGTIYAAKGELGGLKITISLPLSGGGSVGNKHTAGEAR